MSYVPAVAHSQLSVEATGQSPIQSEFHQCPMCQFVFSVSSKIHGETPSVDHSQVSIGASDQSPAQSVARLLQSSVNYLVYATLGAVPPLHP